MTEFPYKTCIRIIKIIETQKNEFKWDIRESKQKKSICIKYKGKKILEK